MLTLGFFSFINIKVVDVRGGSSRYCVQVKVNILRPCEGCCVFRRFQVRLCDGESPTVRGVLRRKWWNEMAAEVSWIWLKYYGILKMLNYSSMHNMSVGVICVCLQLILLPVCLCFPSCKYKTTAFSCFLYVRTYTCKQWGAFFEKESVCVSWWMVFVAHPSVRAVPFRRAFQCWQLISWSKGGQLKCGIWEKNMRVLMHR